MTFAPESRIDRELRRLGPKGKYRICFLEKPQTVPFKVGRGGKHVINPPGTMCTRAWLNTKQAVVGNCKNGWTIVEVGCIIDDGLYDPYWLDRWPDA